MSTQDIANRLRRKVKPAMVANIAIGAPNPVVIQSMTTTSTLDTKNSVAQVASLAHAGASIVRLTAQGVRHAANLACIKTGLMSEGVNVPLVADIHFNPAAAFEAAKHVEKVRINPGNFFDPGRTFRKMEFTDSEYAAELAKIRKKFVPFLQLCKDNKTAIRIGVNHGSLSDRIMSRFGDGADGMVESALEYLRICCDESFDNVVVSIKASDVPLMTDTVRLLVERMATEGMAYPLHLGVTEAGNALEGRIKSAVGIGSLLIDGIGDTIRVSLSEAPENEIPVAKQIIEHCAKALVKGGNIHPERSKGRRITRPTAFGIGGLNTTAIIGDILDDNALPADGSYLDITASGDDAASIIRQTIDNIQNDSPAIMRISYPETFNYDELVVKASVDFGSLLLAGYQDAIQIQSPILTREQSNDLAKKIIQAAGITRFQAEIVACPGCGRTLFELPKALEKVKEACIHLKHLKIAVMGCIVNGPGEMAGADYGYVGAAVGNVSIYRGTECVIKNISQDEALTALTDLIKSDGKWVEKN